MREMVFRERQEKVAHMEAFTQIVGKLFNLDTDRVFGVIVKTYAGEVFQETYDAELLKQKMAVIRQAQERIRNLRQERARQLTKLDRLGEYYDRKFGTDLFPSPDKLKAPTARPGIVKPMRPIKPPQRP